MFKQCKNVEFYSRVELSKIIISAIEWSFIV